MDGSGSDGAVDNAAGVGGGDGGSDDVSESGFRGRRGTRRSTRFDEGAATEELPGDQNTGGDEPEQGEDDEVMSSRAALDSAALSDLVQIQQAIAVNPAEFAERESKVVQLPVGNNSDLSRAYLERQRRRDAGLFVPELPVGA